MTFSTGWVDCNRAFYLLRLFVPAVDPLPAARQLAVSGLHIELGRSGKLCLVPAQTQTFCLPLLHPFPLLHSRICPLLSQDDCVFTSHPSQAHSSSTAKLPPSSKRQSLGAAPAVTLLQRTTGASLLKLPLLLHRWAVLDLPTSTRLHTWRWAMAECAGPAQPPKQTRTGNIQVSYSRFSPFLSLPLSLSQSLRGSTLPILLCFSGEEQWQTGKHSFT